MPSSKLNPRSTRKHLQSFRFADLFIEDLGWNHPESRKPTSIEIDGTKWTAAEISQLSGFRVFEIASNDPETSFPDAKTQQALWKHIAPHAVENLLIFVDAARTRSAWLWMKRDGSGNSPTHRPKTQPRRHHYLKGQPGDLFLSKLASLVVDLSELDEDGNIPITETAKRVRAGLDIETVTKAFFKDFQDEHGKLLLAIEGIPDPGERRWYASVLLNRLMFIWFLQKKGFLDVARTKVGNLDYLPEKLAASQKAGKNHFFSRFLRDLFFEGFAKTEDKRETIGTVPLGDIPYLNGGLFLPHGIEARIEGEALFAKAYQKIKVPDLVFADLFALFSRYSWSLNDTPGGDDREINPDVLGYIFEKYINQKEFGAYYTRPEITDYLCEQTIHQLVLDRVNASYAAAKKLHETDPKAFPAPRRYESIEDLLLHATGPVAQKVLQDILPQLSLLDPACGSGAFLVAALKTLLNLYTALIGRCEALAHQPVLQWIEHEKKQHKAPIAYWLKKKIVTENLHGVDLMEEATEIAKLRLFLSLVASADSRDQLEPLPNIEFNLLPGNSLIGLLHVDPTKFDGRTGILPVSENGHPARSSSKRLQQSRIALQYEEALGFTTETTAVPTTRETQQAHVAVKQAAKYDELLRRKNERIDLYKKSTSLFKDLAALKRDIDALKTEARAILDQLLLDQFNALGIQYEQATWIPNSPAPTGQNIPAQGNALGKETPQPQALKGRHNPGGKEGKPEKRPLKLADIEALQPFHWAYEFDQIIVTRGGFDAIITNPPWDIFKPNSKEFFERYSDLVTRNKMRIEEFEKEKTTLISKDPEIREAWLSYLSAFPHQSLYFRNSTQYANQIGTVDGRKVGSDINLYKLFLEQCTHLLNKGARCGIVIPSGIYTDLGATQLRNMLYEQTCLEGLFCFENRQRIFDGVDSRFKFVILTFENAGSTKEFPVAFMRQDVRDLSSFPAADSLTLSPALIRRLSPGSGSMMEFKTAGDIAIAEKLLRHPLLGETLPDTWNIGFTAEFHMTNDSDLFETEPAKGRLPLYEGKMIWQFQHGYTTPRYWIDETSGRERVLGKGNDIGQKLDYQEYRLGFRDIARNTDTRTLISSIIPPLFHGNKLPTVKVMDNGKRMIGLPGQLFLCAAWNSFVLDWVIRQKVTTTLNFFYIYQLPIPRLTAKDPDFLPLVERAARLVGTTAEFDGLLQEVFGKKATHKTHGVTDPQERLTLRAQIDALVARLYDLTQEEFQHILTTFPLVDESVKSQTFNTYRDLLKLGKLPDPRQ
jgi:hypothetical protein